MSGQPGLMGFPTPQTGGGNLVRSLGFPLGRLWSQPSVEVLSTFGSLSGTYKWFGGVLAANGAIYGIPFSSTSVLKIETGRSLPLADALAPERNKF